jgi:hypothetical protein
MPEWGIPLREVADMATFLPVESATRRSLDPHWQRTPEVDLLRDVEYGLRILAWQQTEKGAKGVGYPEPMRLPWDPTPEGTISGDTMTMDEADRWLGFDKIREARDGS